MAGARSTLAVYENGLEITVHGKSIAFCYDQLTAITAKYTHHKMNHQYIGTKARLECLIEGRFSPCVYEGDFRRGTHAESVLAAAIAACCQAIERRLLAELERAGAVHWRDNVWLTADGIQLKDRAGDANKSRLISYREIGEWKIADNQLKVWRTSDGLPCFVIGNETENFGPLYGLFESLCRGTRSIDPTCEVEPELVAAGV
jgi:hypothetical protein